MATLGQVYKSLFPHEGRRAPFQSLPRLPTDLLHSLATWWNVQAPICVSACKNWMPIRGEFWTLIDTQEGLCPGYSAAKTPSDQYCVGLSTMPHYLYQSSVPVRPSTFR